MKNKSTNTKLGILFLEQLCCKASLIIIFSLLMLSSTYASEEKKEIPIIKLTEEILEESQKLQLSELIRSVDFIQLGTNDSSLVSNWDGFVFSKDYIYIALSCFNWKGEWLGNIGTKGGRANRRPYDWWSYRF